MDFKKHQDSCRKRLKEKWKEFTMKFKIDIEPEDLLSFDKMIALPAIKIMYIVGLFCVALFGLSVMFQGGVSNFFFGLSFLVVGPVIWRITCEVAILLFGIYDRLGDIKGAVLKLEAANEQKGSKPEKASAPKVAADKKTAKK